MPGFLVSPYAKQGAILGDLTLEFDFTREPRPPLLLDPNPLN